LAAWSEAFSAELVRLGYAKRTTALQMSLVSGLSWWMEQRELGAEDISPEVLEEFLRSVCAKARSFQPTVRTLAWLLEHLRQQGLVNPVTVPSPPSMQEELIDRYRRYVVEERGLTKEAAENYARTAGQFMADQDSRGESALEHITAAAVTRFVTRHCRTLSVGSAKMLATGLRSFLGFAQLTGLTSLALAAWVPSAAGWSGAGLPRGLAPGEVSRLLASCDRRSSTGQRDFAILVVLSRLGLRAAEVAGLSIDDIDWRAGELVVRGKGRCEERLPLPVDVGEAIASYLQQGRPRRPERELFLRVHAPLRRLSSEGVAEVVRAASERAGLGSFGSHRLRHTAATEMLRAGATLSEVAQVLRHRSMANTVLYAKVDHLALVALAMPWPGVAR